MKSWWLVVVGVVLGLVAGFFAFRKPAIAPTVNTNNGSNIGTNVNAGLNANASTNLTPVGASNSEDIGNADEKADRITVSKPKPNAAVASPLTVSGQARGTWFFEGEFRVRLLDANSKEIVAGNATAQGEWMTTEFVPFTVKLEFDKPSTAKGTLVLHKANPSGLAENDDELRVPVKF
jgi:hypothetical protein